MIQNSNIKLKGRCHLHFKGCKRKLHLTWQYWGIPAFSLCEWVHGVCDHVHCYKIFMANSLWCQIPVQVRPAWQLHIYCASLCFFCAALCLCHVFFSLSPFVNLLLVLPHQNKRFLWYQVWYFGINVVSAAGSLFVHVEPIPWHLDPQVKFIFLLTSS